MCHGNQLVSLEGGPEYVGRYMDCSDNKLESLKYAPKNTMQDFYCAYNKLQSLDSFNINLKRNFDCEGNPIYYIYNNYIKSIENIELFNDYRIIEGNTLYLKRLNGYLSTNKYYPVESTSIIRHFKQSGYIIK